MVLLLILINANLIKKRTTFYICKADLHREDTEREIFLTQHDGSMAKPALCKLQDPIHTPVCVTAALLPIQHWH